MLFLGCFDIKPEDFSFADSLLDILDCLTMWLATHILPVICRGCSADCLSAAAGCTPCPVLFASPGGSTVRSSRVIQQDALDVALGVTSKSSRLGHTGALDLALSAVLCNRDAALA